MVEITKVDHNPREPKPFRVSVDGHQLPLSRFATQASFSVVDDFNKFLLETFGTKEMCYVVWDKVVVSHATMERLEAV